MRRSTAILLLASCSCGRYATFTLPELAGPPQKVAFLFETQPDPVLPRGPAGSWDAVDTLNPSVVRHHNKYFNFYSGFDGKTWHTGLALSTDGIHWERQGRILSPDPATWEGDYIAANGHALHIGNDFFYWYQAGIPPRIGLARSPDGRQWSKLPRPVLEPGPYRSFDERGVADPYVIRAGRDYYLFYLGQDRAARQRLGVARSPDGISWTRLRDNPILELGPFGAFDENGLGEPAVWAQDGAYWMLYTGRDRHENRRLGLAVSHDGVHWERRPEVFTGNAPWMSKVICDPTIEPLSNGVRVWFGGGDQPRPAERLNGQVGVATLVPQR